MKDWRAAWIGVAGSPLIDNNSTKERRGFLEQRRLGEGFRYRVSCKRCFGLRFWCKVSSMKHCALSQIGKCQIEWARRRECFVGSQ